MLIAGDIGGTKTVDRHMDPSHVRTMIEQVNQQLAADGKAPFQLKTIPQGAATSVWPAVVAPAAEIGGHYCENCTLVTSCHVTFLSPRSAKEYADMRSIRPMLRRSERKAKN
jgi:hypothetical protein